MRKGTRTPGHGLPLFVVKVDHGTKGVKADNAGGGLGGRMTYVFPKAEKRSKYGRHEIDALLTGDRGKAVNSTQKSVEETRLLVRVFTPDRRPVVSVCNGTATAQVVALLEGRESLGVESDRVQNLVARRRLQTLYHRESLLKEALREKRDPDYQSVGKLEDDVRETCLLDDEVSSPVVSNVQRPFLGTP